MNSSKIGKLYSLVQVKADKEMHTLFIEKLLKENAKQMFVQAIEKLQIKHKTHGWVIASGQIELEFNYGFDVDWKNVPQEIKEQVYKYGDEDVDIPLPRAWFVRAHVLDSNGKQVNAGRWVKVQKESKN